MWTSISGENAFTSSGKSVVRKPSCHIHPYSRTTSQRRVTSLHVLLMGSQTPGKVTGTATVCASKFSAPTQPRNCRKSSRYVSSDLTCKRAIVTSWQRLFREIVVWRRLSHPNILPVLGVAPQPSPLCTVTEWMTNGNIMEFTSTRPEVNRLRLVRMIPDLPRSPQS